MAKSFTFSFTEFEPGYFIAWTITSQCYNTGKVTIRSSGKTLVTAIKDGHDNSLMILDQNRAFISSNIVEVEVTINEAVNDLKNSKMGGAIMDNAGSKVGYVYDVCIEDSTDSDYNDIYVNLVGWKKRG
jgi:hypothetical protein